MHGGAVSVFTVSAACHGFYASQPTPVSLVFEHRKHSQKAVQCIRAQY